MKLLAKSIAAIFQHVVFHNTQICHIVTYIFVQAHALLWLHSILSTMMVQSHYPIAIASGMGMGQQWSWNEAEVSSPYRESPSLFLQCPSPVPG